MEDQGKCVLCEGAGQGTVELLFGYSICKSCKSGLGLLRDETIRKHFVAYEAAKSEDPRQLSYEEEIQRRLDFIEKDLIRKKIKLLHVMERLDAIEKA